MFSGGTALLVIIWLAVLAGVSTGEDNVVSTGEERENVVSTEEDNGVGTGEENGVITGEGNGVGTGEENGVSTGEENRVRTGEENEVSTGEENKLGTGEENGISTGEENGLGTREENGVSTGEENGVSTGEANEVTELQELLRGFSSTIKDLKSFIESSESAMKSVSNSKPRDCADIWKSGNRSSGIYRVWPDKWGTVGSFEVYCDMDTDGGGWTVFQRRGDYGSRWDFFCKTWDEYKNGFGQLDKEFWLGNERIFALTNQDSYELRVDLWKDMEGEIVYAQYDQFWLENEDQKYRLKLYGYSGNAGDDLSSHSGIPFTTRDRNNVQMVGQTKCAPPHKEGWWFTNCFQSSLHGLYPHGIRWYPSGGHRHPYPRSEMKFRPRNFKN